MDLIGRAGTRVGRQVRRLRRRIGDGAQRLRALGWQLIRREERQPPNDDLERSRRDREVDEASEESFPASDPPSWTSRGTC